jgi:protein gp37
MGFDSKIEWTESTWNPITGCTKISSGCKNCYAERMAKRLKAMGQRNYANGFDVTVHESAFELPLRWKKPQMVFVNSMSDLFHDSVPTSCIKHLFAVMNQADWHVFQILTKRSPRLAHLGRDLPWSDHIWMGVTVENAESAHRIDDLRACGAKVKFVSLEPLLGPLAGIDLDDIDWVIAGGESGPGARPMEAHWVRDIRDQCLAAGIPFFFKQWGGVNKKKNGRLLDGTTHNAMPSQTLVAR